MLVIIKFISWKRVLNQSYRKQTLTLFNALDVYVYLKYRQPNSFNWKTFGRSSIDCALVSRYILQNKLLFQSWHVLSLAKQNKISRATSCHIISLLTFHATWWTIELNIRKHIGALLKVYFTMLFCKSNIIIQGFIFLFFEDNVVLVKMIYSVTKGASLGYSKNI